jgi:hypothetical protein
MLIDLLFSNSDGLGEFPSAHFPLAQELNHLLTNGLHLISFLFLLENSRKEREHNIFKGLIPPNGEHNPFNWHGAPAAIRTRDLRIRSSFFVNYSETQRTKMKNEINYLGRVVYHNETQ